MWARWWSASPLPEAAHKECRLRAMRLKAAAGRAAQSALIRMEHRHEIALGLRLFLPHRHCVAADILACADPKRVANGTAAPSTHGRDRGNGDRRGLVCDGGTRHRKSQADRGRL